MEKNAKYLSPQIQNQLITICDLIIKDDIVQDIKKSFAYSILADETADISGKEQLSVGIRFFDEEKCLIREEFLGFVELNAMNAKCIADEIQNFISTLQLDESKCVGQGYDGCSTMAGKEGGVQNILRQKFKKALFFHCASHKLNLVVNDLNVLPEIRNTIGMYLTVYGFTMNSSSIFSFTGTIKDIINFFRESPLRRKCIPSIPMLCETRWSHKYKSIARFKENFVDIVETLERLTGEGNQNTRKHAFQLHCAATQPDFVFSVFVIAQYSLLLEPTANILQSKTMDLLQCAKQIKLIMAVLQEHRTNAQGIVDGLLFSIQENTANLGIEMSVPRIVSRQTHRSNPPFSSPAEYWKRSIYIPYIDSLISSLDRRFNEENRPAFAIHCLHPSNMLSLKLEELKDATKTFEHFYELGDLEGEIELWYNSWQQKKMGKDELADLELASILKDAGLFYPNIRKALLISLSQPCTTATVERSFSTLRRVKTWLRSTMTEARLNGKIICNFIYYQKISIYILQDYVC